MLKLFLSRFVVIFRKSFHYILETLDVSLLDCHKTDDGMEANLYFEEVV